jgi:hypothetical protein
MFAEEVLSSVYHWGSGKHFPFPLLDARRVSEGALLQKQNTRRGGRVFGSDQCVVD